MSDYQRQTIKRLLIPDYWRAEADAIIDAALAVGYTLDEIAWTITAFNLDTVIYNTFVRGAWPHPRGTVVIV